MRPVRSQKPKCRKRSFNPALLVAALRGSQLIRGRKRSRLKCKLPPPHLNGYAPSGVTQ